MEYGCCGQQATRTYGRELRIAVQLAIHVELALRVELALNIASSTTSTTTTCATVYHLIQVVCLRLADGRAARDVRANEARASCVSMWRKGVERGGERAPAAQERERAGGTAAQLAQGQGPYSSQ